MAKKQAENKGGLPLLKKVTAKTVLGVPVKKIAAEYDDGEIDLFKISGVITRCRALSTQYGDSVGFKGQFIVQCTCKDSPNFNKVWRGIEFFAPGDLEDELISQFQTRDGNEPVQFGAAIAIQIDPESNAGYIYVSEPLIETAPTDMLAAVVEKAFGKTLTALSAPGK